MNAVGQPISRADGRLKVTGGAHYTADIPLAGAAHAAIVHSTIANGRTVSIDTTAAERAPGVLAVFTHRNMPRMNPTPKPWSHLHPHGQCYLPLQDDKIHYAGQPVALVVAATLDQASHAGTLIKVGTRHGRRWYSAANVVEGGSRSSAIPLAGRSSVGDAEKGLAAAAVKIEQTYTTADRHHNQMEPHATTAVWDADGTLTLYDTTQHIFGTKELVVDRARHSAREDQCRVPFSSAAASAARPMSGRTPCWPRLPRRRSTGRCACSLRARRCIRWSDISRRPSRRSR